MDSTTKVEQFPICYHFHPLSTLQSPGDDERNIHYIKLHGSGDIPFWLRRLRHQQPEQSENLNGSLEIDFQSEDEY